MADHPYTIMAGGERGEVHGNKLIVERPDFLFSLLPENRRHLTLPSGEKLYYARMFGGEFRERQANESDSEAGPIKVLFVQGLGGTHANWTTQLAHFAHKPEFDLVAMDTRGVGFSHTPSGRFRTSDLAEDINALIRGELKWSSNVHLVGFSLGGMAALEAALHAPELFQSVSLLSTHAGGVVGTMLPPNGIQPFLKTFGTLGTVGALDAGMELLHSIDYLDTELKQVPADVQRQVELCGFKGTVTNRFKTAFELIQEARKYFESGEFPEIRIEGTLKQMTAAVTHYVSWDRLQHLKSSGISFLVVGGRHDNLVNYLNQPMLHRAVGARKLVLKQDSGHAVNLHHRDEINEVLEEHFKTSKPVPVPVKPMLPHAIHPWTAFIFTAMVVFRWMTHLGVFGLKRFAFACSAASLLVRARYGPIYK